MILYARQQKRHRYKEQTFGLWEKARVGWFERIALKHIYYHMWNSSPVQVWCMRQGAQGWCTGMTVRDAMGRKVGGGSGWGTHVHPWLIHVNVWQTPPQYYKVTSLQLKLKQTNKQKKQPETIWNWISIAVVQLNFIYWLKKNMHEVQKKKKGERVGT